MFVDEDLILPPKVSCLHRWSAGVFLEFLGCRSVELSHELVAFGLCRSEAFLWSRLAQLLDAVLCQWLQARRELQPYAQDVATGFILVASAKGRFANNHLVQQHTHLPHVQTFIVTFSTNHFWGQVVWCTAEGGPVGDILQDVRPSKVSKFSVLIFVQQNVFGLDVPVNNLRRLGVQVLQGITDFVKMSSCELTGELAILTEQVEHPAALGKLHSQVHVALVLEAEVKLHDVWMSQASHDVDLPLHLLCEAMLLYERQWDFLHCPNGCGRSTSAVTSPNLSKVATAQRLVKL
mmetsp:Transcript_12092/g.25294  ORF Transcript_12092/g.25294 Transcript_12092/m.25294 type:complete len:292 (+) Transcript_12092:263-1138(+)